MCRQFNSSSLKKIKEENGRADGMKETEVFGSFVWTIIYLSPAVNSAKYPMKIEGSLFLQKGMNKP